MPPRAQPRAATESAAVQQHLDAVRRRLDAAAHSAGRLPGDVRLIAVSKTFPADDVRDVAAAGQRDFGENRVQEGLAKIEALADLGLEWHLIGHLQSNKARKAAAAFGWIHSVDRAELLTKLDAAAREAGTRPRVLIQVDLAREASKHGADAAAVRDLVHEAAAAGAVQLSGLMIIPPAPDRPEDSRPWFRRLRELREALVADGIPAVNLRELSMGMSQDFEVAIEEGATMVRVGTAIFGNRPRATQP
jgi:pyridoxal phosphate enzyme (YggS family)